MVNTVKKEKPKIIFTTGKRRIAVARAKVKQGTGKILINSKPIEIWGNEKLRLWVKEPIILADELGKIVDIKITARSGGIMGQAEAIRMAVARGLVAFSKNEKLKQKYLEYDRNLLVYDPRRNEPHKPSASKRGARRHKQRSKR